MGFGFKGVGYIIGAMKTRSFRLTEIESAALKQAEQQTKRPSELRRMQAVRLYGSGTDTAQISDITGMSERSMQRMAACFREQGIARLHDQRRGGNRSLLTEAARREIANKLHTLSPGRPAPQPARILDGERPHGGSGAVVWGGVQGRG